MGKKYEAIWGIEIVMGNMDDERQIPAEETGAGRDQLEEGTASQPNYLSEDLDEEGEE